MAAGKAELAIDGATLSVSGVLDFDSVVPLQAQGQQWIESTAPAQFTLELAAVQYSSSAGLALLLDWMRVAASSGKQLRISGMPADMSALAHVSGLEEILVLS
jgi:phospholipid transport system transporter-binding protein